MHSRALEQWEALCAAGARLHTSVPVVIETFTFLERNAKRGLGVERRYSQAECLENSHL
jgi:hypothetical protein